MRVSWLNLHHWIPQRDVRKLIYKKLDFLDRFMTEWAHSGHRSLFGICFAEACAKRGYLQLLQWARNNKYSYYQDRNMCLYAGEHGHLHVMEWLRTPEGGNWSWDCVDWILLPRKGHLHVLKALHANGINFTTEHTCMLAAAFGGHLEVLQWLRSIGCHWNASVLKIAKKYKHWEVLSWATENGCPDQ
jgi:hypothetical protein